VSRQYPHLYLIGLTGNIGCGKSTVSRSLAARGAAICDADAVTRIVMQPGQPAYAAIVATFGDGILTALGGPIDRSGLGRIVFSDPGALGRLEAIVHPATRMQIMAWLDEQEEGAQRHGQPAVAVVDAIRLIEAGYPAICDSVWVVTCDAHEQLRRLVESRGMSEADARQRIAAQPPQAAKAAVADVVIDNSGSLEATEEQIEAAWKKHVATRLGATPV
jgi:dephospho-CoA kinase